MMKNYNKFEQALQKIDELYKESTKYKDMDRLEKIIKKIIKENKQKDKKNERT
jgi:hypothetical protein